MSRDVYRSKVYRAERVAFADQPLVKRSHERAAARLHEVCETNAAWRAAAGERADRPVTVNFATGHTSWARSMDWTIALSRGHVCQDWVILHELAHLPTPNAFPAHGREFTSLYIAIVRDEYGDQIADRLTIALVEAGCPVRRDPGYVTYLRRNLTLVSSGRDRFKEANVLTTSGRYVWLRSGWTFVEDVLIVGAASEAATPESLHLDEIAYLTAIKKTKHEMSRGSDWL